MTITAAAPEVRERPDPMLPTALNGHPGRATGVGIAAVWLLRSLLLVPLILMGPEIVSGLEHRPQSAAHLSASAADVLGTSTFLIFVVMLAVTPLATITGWRWHVVLRRDYGIAMFFSAAIDLTIAALTTGDTFSGGVLARVGGHTFLYVGVLSTALLIPLVLTANRRAQRWLGSRWRTVQRLTYVVWFTILLHLLLLFGFRSFARDAIILSLPLALLRLPPVRGRFISSRRNRTHPVARALLSVVMLSVFTAGFVPFVQELAVKGSAAFHQAPVDD